MGTSSGVKQQKKRSGTLEARRTAEHEKKYTRRSRRRSRREGGQEPVRAGITTLNEGSLVRQDAPGEPRRVVPREHAPGTA